MCSWSESISNGSVGRKDSGRLYNFPWVARFHLAMYRATGDSSQLDRFVRVVRSYYKRDGKKHLSMEIPITEGLKTLEEAGRAQEKAELLLRAPLPAGDQRAARREERPVG
ncbi:MAG TPA: hypothetical protein VF064_14750 [Pyrinomonadaceae bacterium]